MSKRIGEVAENAILAKMETVDADTLDDALAEVSDLLDDVELSAREQVVGIADALARVGLTVA